MIYISTGGIKGKHPHECCKILNDFGFHEIELSGGLYHPSTLDKLMILKSSNRFSVHNYFPPPEVPFVLNLASTDNTIRNRSIIHCKTAIEWASKLGSKHYGVHSGFLLDPLPSELGKRVKKRELQDRDHATSLFISSVSELNQFASEYGIRLYIENNVLSKNNMNEFNANPFLMADTAEINSIMSKLPSTVSLLLDVAHLKVSANTMNLDLMKEYELIYDRINAYHLSDNNGLEDSNEKFTADSWFIRHLKKTVDHSTIEVYEYEKNTLSKLLGALHDHFA